MLKMTEELEQAVTAQHGGPLRIAGAERSYVVMSDDMYRELSGVADDSDLDESVAALQTALPRKPRGAIWYWVGSGAAPNEFESLPELVSSVGAGHTPSNLPVVQKIKAGDPCYLIFTSGTTGMPKAAVMTHLRWLKSGYGIGQMAMRLQADDVFYCPLPF